MKRLIKLLCFTMIIVLIFTFSGCKPEEPGNGFDFQEVYEIALERGYEGTLEELIELFKGEAGLPGADGATWYTGEGAPADTSGNNGDFYLDTVTFDVYLKGGGSWHLITNIIGPKGEKGGPGKDGATWHNGAADPSGSIGKDGDFYINTITFDVFLKGSGDWFSIGNIKGGQGAPGKSAYELAVENGFEGSLQEWLDSLKGESAYEIYLKYNPEYEGDEEQWIDDLVNGRLKDAEPEPPTEGLQYTLTRNGESYAVSVGTATDEKRIVIPSEYNGKSVTEIAYQGFKDCVSLESISIPESVTRIRQVAFYGTGIWNKTDDNSVVYADKWAVGYKGTLLLSWQTTLRLDTVGISDLAFSSAFHNEPFDWYFSEITIPESVKYIGYMAFSGCEWGVVVMQSEIPPKQSDSFFDFLLEDPSIYGLIVPDAAYQTYIDAWEELTAFRVYFPMFIYEIMYPKPPSVLLTYC